MKWINIYHNRMYTQQSVKSQERYSILRDTGLEIKEYYIFEVIKDEYEKKELHN